MRCAEVNEYLDRLMDDQLTDEQRRELETHGRECAACAEQIRATMQMKALFAEMPAEIDVPLPAQAKWRDAVRKEAQRARMKRFYRWAGAAAAAIVVMVGVGLSLNGTIGAPKAVMPLASDTAAFDMADEEIALEAGDYIALDDSGAINQAMVYDEKGSALMSSGTSGAVVESDGQALGTMEPEAAPLAAQVYEIRLVVEDIEAARASILDLVQEYEGSVEENGSDFYVDLPGGNAAEFVSAVAYLDQSDQSLQIEAPQSDGTITLLLTLSQK